MSGSGLLPSCWDWHIAFQTSSKKRGKLSHMIMRDPQFLRVGPCLSEFLHIEEVNEVC